MANIDFALQDEGAIFILTPLTPEGESWINENEIGQGGDPQGLQQSSGKIVSGLRPGFQA